MTIYKRSFVVTLVISVISFLIAAIILETLAFYISSNGVIESIPKSPIAVIVGLVIFLQGS